MEFPRWLEYESSDGSMALVRVRRVVQQTCRVKVYFDHNAALSMSALHAFVGFRDGSQLLIRSGDLQSGDLIWLDVSAFIAVGALMESMGL